MAPLTISDAKLQEIAQRLFLLKSPAPAKLPKPTNTGPDSFTSKFAGIATDPRFKDMGIGVVDFSGEGFPKVWLHNGDDAWRIGSTCKLALHLAAVQLRDDVRQLQDVLSTPDEFDQLFAMRRLWSLYKGPDKEGIQHIAGPGNAPRISTIFDVSKSPADFIGPPAVADDAFADDVFLRMPLIGHRGSQEIKHLTWATAGDFDFSERLWMAGALSDNVAATACASEIGLPYIKALMRAYGLFEPRQGMYLQMSGGMSEHDFVKEPVLIENARPEGAKYRPLTHVQNVAKVKDLMRDLKTGNFTDQFSWEPGSAAALTAYMIALMHDKLVDPTSFMLAASERGIQGSETIRNNLSAGQRHSVVSYLVQGVGSFASGADVTREVSKIGILGKADRERSGLICEFSYLESAERGFPSPNIELKFAVLATGISGLIMGGSQGDADFLSKELGEAVHLALLKP